MNAYREHINLIEALPPSIIEEVMLKQKQRQRLVNPTVFTATRFLVEIGYELNKHSTPEFYQSFLLDIDVTFSISVPAAYEVIEDLGYGSYICLKTSAGALNFLRLNKEIGAYDSASIKHEIRNRVKPHDQEFYANYIQPFEEITVEPSIPKPNKDWWFANKPKRTMTEETVERMLTGRQRNKEQRKAEKERLKQSGG